MEGSIPLPGSDKQVSVQVRSQLKSASRPFTAPDERDESHASALLGVGASGVGGVVAREHLARLVALLARTSSAVRATLSCV